MSSRAVSQRPPFPLGTMVPRTGDYAYDGGVWDSSIVQGPLSPPVPNPSVTIRNFFIDVAPSSPTPRGHSADAASSSTSRCTEEEEWSGQRQLVRMPAQRCTSES
jgi:hypothetical protein